MQDTWELVLPEAISYATGKPDAAGGPSLSHAHAVCWFIAAKPDCKVGGKPDEAEGPVIDKLWHSWRLVYAGGHAVYIRDARHSGRLWSRICTHMEASLYRVLIVSKGKPDTAGGPAAY